MVVKLLISDSSENCIDCGFHMKPLGKKLKVWLVRLPDFNRHERMVQCPYCGALKNKGLTLVDDEVTSEAGFVHRDSIRMDSSPAPLFGTGSSVPSGSQPPEYGQGSDPGCARLLDISRRIGLID